MMTMAESVDFSSLVHEMPDMVAVANRERIFYANPAWTATLGWPLDRIIDGDFSELVHPDDRAETAETIASVWAGTPNVRYGNRVRHRDGHYVDLRWSLVAHGDQLHATGRDISHYRELREQLGESLAISSGVLATAVDPIIVIDTHGVVVDANHATAVLFGFATEDIIGNNVSMLMPEPYRSGHNGYINDYLTGGEAKVIGRDREVEARRADGTTFPMALAVSEVVTGQRHLFTGIIHDLSERNRQREELQEAARLLEARVEARTAALEQLLTEFERSNEDLERFAYIASHDLQAPLRNVRQGLELLDEHLGRNNAQGFDAEADELRGLVLDSIGRMESLIAGLLSYSRVQTSEMQTELDSVNLQQLVADVLAFLAADIANADATVHVSELPTIQGRETLLGQVVQNLLANALRYGSPDRRLEISIEAEIVDEMVKLSIGDNGTGIDESQHGRIFEMFRRGTEAHNGVGIGLALCRRIVEGHGGTISVESAPDHGARFVCQLPLRALPAVSSLQLDGSQPVHASLGPNS